MTVRGDASPVIDLTRPISTFFEATNRHDADAVADCFAESGVVRDESRDHSGRTAIRKWADQTYRDYDVTLTPRDVRDDGSGSAVTAEVVGTFPGSPIELQFRFSLADGRISELVIG